MRTNPRHRSTPIKPRCRPRSFKLFSPSLRLAAIRDQLDTVLIVAARFMMILPRALTWLCTAEVARKNQLRLEMVLRLATCPYL